MKDGGMGPLRFPWETPPEIGEVIEVSDGVLWTRLPLPMALDHVNIFVLDEGDSWTVVDTGFRSRKGRALWEDLLSGPLKGRPVSRVLVTHHHPDHIGMAGWFQTEHGAELVTTRTAWLTARMLTLDEQDLPTKETLAFWQSAGMDPDIFAKRATERPFNFADMVAPLPLGYTRIVEGQTIRLGQRDWVVRMGNGHAPEHATLWATDERLVLGGDQLLPSISPNLGVYATEPEADPVGEWLRSCEALREHARESQLVLPGHKLCFTGLPARMEQLIENHHSALDRLREALAEPKTAHECFVPIFKREITGGAYGLALVEAVAHLNHLWLRGEAIRERRSDGAWLYRRT